MSGILAGGLLGLLRKKPLSPTHEAFFKVSLGAFTVFYGLRLSWLSLNGSWGQILKQILIGVVAMMLGKLAGRMLRLQDFSNQIGRGARDSIASMKPNQPRRISAGFKICAALYCASPLGILGAAQDGLSGYFQVLAVKGVIDGLAALGFAMMFGAGVLLAIVPLFVLQGTIYLICVQLLNPFFAAHSGIEFKDSINFVGGLLVFCMAMLVLGIRKISVADYLPSLIFAPLLTWLFR